MQYLYQDYQVRWDCERQIAGATNETVVEIMDGRRGKRPMQEAYLSELCKIATASV